MHSDSDNHSSDSSGGNELNSLDASVSRDNAPHRTGPGPVDVKVAVRARTEGNLA